MQKLPNVSKVNCRPFSSAWHQNHPNSFPKTACQFFFPCISPGPLLHSTAGAGQQRGKIQGDETCIQGNTLQAGKVLKWTELEADLTLPK